MQDNNTPDNESSNPFQLNLNEIKSAGEPAAPQPVAPMPAEPSRQPQPQFAIPEPVPQSTPAATPEPTTQRTVDRASRETVYVEAEPQMQRRVAFAIAMPVLAATLIFAYWPTMVELFRTWTNNIDYHHGFFVAPFTAYFLWVRRDNFPAKQGRLDAVLGIALGAVLLLGWGAFRYYVMVRSMDSLDPWTILIWVLAVCLMCFGMRVFLWALPSLLFLAFMFPWPHTVEMMLRGPLQEVAAKLSVYMLRLVGEHAIAVGNVVLMSDNQRLDVEAACSGIRVLVSVIAAAYAAALLMRRPWWQNVLLFCLVVPVALFVNALRIANTGLLVKHASGLVESFGFEKATPVVCDEISGTVMLILTFLFFIVIIWWFGKVFHRVEVREQQARIRRTE